jgi:endonuclease G
MQPNLRDPQRHGTHVASIAAGRRGSGQPPFAGGVAPAAKIVVVIAKLESDPGDPVSIGYSRSHVEALQYIDAVAAKHDLPVVINVSLGMNAGAHDGTSLLEVGFDEFTKSGTKQGRIIVKSAGNERGQDGHAQFTVPPGVQVSLRWDSQPIPRSEDVIELWFSPQDELTFTLKAPDGSVAPLCTSTAPEIQGAFPSGNTYTIVYDAFHVYAGDSLCRIVIRRGAAAAIQTGVWELSILGTRIRSRGVIQAWLERINTRPTRFLTFQCDDMTLSIPGTVKSVITVGAVNSGMPLQSEPNSSFGPTRKNGEKPDLVAPGTAIVAAHASTTSGTLTLSGTSMAAPHVTGAVALVLSRQKKLDKPLLSAAQARQALITRTQNYNGFHSAEFGYGLLDVEAFYRTFIPN